MAFFILDYVKDIILWVYLYSKLEDITNELVSFLIYLHGITIILASVIMGIYLHLSPSSMLARIKSPILRVFLGILSLPLTPLMPVVIILRATSLSIDQTRLAAEWRRTRSISASQQWLRCDRLSHSKRKVMVMFSDMKLVECNLEAIPQLFFLIVYIFVSGTDSVSLGLSGDDSTTWSVLILSIILTFVYIISSLLTAVSIRKRGQVSVKGKCLLGVSFTFQIVGRLILMFGMFGSSTDSIARICLLLAPLLPPLDVPDPPLPADSPLLPPPASQGPGAPHPLQHLGGPSCQEDPGPGPDTQVQGAVLVISTDGGQFSSYCRCMVCMHTREMVSCLNLSHCPASRCTHWVVCSWSCITRQVTHGEN